MFGFKKHLACFFCLLVFFAVLLMIASCGDGETDTDTSIYASNNEECEHILTVLPAILPTCTQSGLSEGLKCSKCDEVLVEQEIIPQQHKFETSYTCNVCNIEIYNESQGLEFTLSDNGKYYIVTGFGACVDTELVIPFTHDGLPVKEIGDQAFYEYDPLKNIIMGDNITTIGYEAFRWCDSLTDVTIGNGVTTIEKHAFSECYSLKDITVYEKTLHINQ